MKPYLILAASLIATTCSSAQVPRNPFEPPPARAGSSKKPAPVADSAKGPPLAELPPIVLPPPVPPAAMPALPAAGSRAAQAPQPSDKFDTVEVPAEPQAKPKTRSRDPATRILANCTLKTNSTVLAAPAGGGTVILPLQVTGGRECLSAVLAEQNWLEVKDINNPAAVRLLVDVNESETPRQSNIVVANAGQSLTVVLMQEGRAMRSH